MLYCLIAGLGGLYNTHYWNYIKKISLVLVGRLIAGLSTASQPIAQAAITDFSQGKRKAFYLSLIGFAMTAAMVLGPVVGGLLSDHSISSLFNPTLPYWLGIVLAASNIFLLLTKYKDINTKKIPKENKVSHPTLIHTVFNRKILPLMLIFLALELGWSLYYQAIYLILNQHIHYSTMQMSLFVGYIGLWMSLGLTIIFHWLIKRFKLSTLLKGSLIVTTLGLLICSLSFNMNMLGQWLGVIPTAVGVGVAYPCILALLSNHTIKIHQGWILGCASTVLSSSWMLSGFALGAIANYSLRLPIIMAAIFFIIAVAISFCKNQYDNT